MKFRMVQKLNEEQHRFIFTVRQRFNSDPNVDCFYKLVSPSGMGSDEIKMMTVLKPGWESDTLKADTHAMSGMSLRLRFNGDLYPNVCLVRSSADLSAKDLEHYIVMKYKDGELDKFLLESRI